MHPPVRGSILLEAGRAPWNVGVHLHHAEDVLPRLAQLRCQLLDLVLEHEHKLSAGLNLSWSSEPVTGVFYVVRVRCDAFRILFGCTVIEEGGLGERDAMSCRVWFVFGRQDTGGRDGSRTSFCTNQCSLEGLSGASEDAETPCLAPLEYASKSAQHSMMSMVTPAPSAPRASA